MGKLSNRLTDALDAVGARLKRDKKHRVYELPNGRNFVVASTPSDARADRNAISDLRAATGVDVTARRKASPEVRAERRRRPGRAGEAPWTVVSSSPFASALRDTGIVEKQLRAEIVDLTTGIHDLAAAVDELSAEIRGRDAHILALESMLAVRVWRFLCRTTPPVHHDAVARCSTKPVEPPTRES